MAIRIKHGAELEGRGLMYGAAAQAAYARQQRKKEEEAEKKAGKLGDIGAVLSTAGAVASFIPGLQPVGVGLSIAGGSLGQLAGGRGGVAGKVIASTAQGISQIYQMQAAKVEERQASYDDWQKRKDYADDASYLRKREELDEELTVRNKGFTAAVRQENRKFQTRRDAVWEATGLHTLSDKELLTIKADPRHPKFQMVTAASNKVQELANTRDRNLQSYQEAFNLDPATTALETGEKIEAKRVQDKKEADQQLETLEKQEAADIEASEKRTAGIVSFGGEISRLEAIISKNRQLDESDEDYLDQPALTSVKNELKTVLAARDQLLEGEKDQQKILMQTSDEAALEGREAWIKQWAVREAGPDANEGLLLSYELQAAELFDSIARSGDREAIRELIEQTAHINVLNKHGIPVGEQYYMFGRGRSETPAGAKRDTAFKESISGEFATPVAGMEDTGPQPAFFEEEQQELWEPTQKELEELWKKHNAQS